MQTNRHPAAKAAVVRNVKTAEVCVIGAGIMGAATAYYLAKSGHDVLLLDRKGILAGGTASQSCAGGVRHQGRAVSELPLALEAIALWRDLEAELAADLGYRREGMTIVTDDERMVPELEKRVAVERGVGLGIDMVYGLDLLHLVPGLTPAVLAGAYCPADGHANPIRTVSAFVRAAVHCGARLELACPALGFVVKEGSVKAVRTPDGAITCDRVVLTAGAWTPKLADAVGVHLPFEAQGLQMMITPRHPHLLRQVLGWMGHGISFKQVPSGGLLIGGGWPGEIELESYRTALLPGSMAKSARTAVALFPCLAGTTILRAWVGIEAFSPDSLQVIGPAPTVDNLFLAAGFSGHGFALGPGVGRLIARYITTGELSGLFLPFDPNRFNVMGEG